MNKVLLQAQKEWMEFRRDKFALALAFLLPIFSLLLFGFGIRFEPKNIPLVINDLDASSLSREYSSRVLSTNIFTPVAWSGAPSEALDRGLAKVAVIIPANFKKQLLAGQAASVQVHLDGTDLSEAQIVYNSLKIADNFFLKAISSTPVKLPVVPELRIFFNPGKKEFLFIVPGVFGVVLWMYPSLLAAVAGSREREQGTMVRLFSTQLSAAELLAGKALTYLGIGLCISVLVFSLGLLSFGLTPVGDITPLLVATPIYVLSAVMFGLFIGTYANSQTVAVQAASTGGFFPSLLLSGFVYPIANIPFPLSLISMAVPARYYIEVTRDVFERGGGWPAVWTAPLILSLFVALFFVISWLRLRPMQLRD
jgi:ABC-2 type transport system permease protein